MTRLNTRVEPPSEARCSPCAHPPAPPYRARACKLRRAARAAGRRENGLEGARGLAAALGLLRVVDDVPLEY